MKTNPETKALDVYQSATRICNYAWMCVSAVLVFDQKDGSLYEEKETYFKGDEIR
jgi:hypothetical protein